MSDEGTAGADQQQQESGQEQQERTFTQAELDRIVQERVARVKREAPPDYEDLRAKAAKLEELEAAQLSELEKAQKAREKAEAKAAEAIERANRRLVEAAIREAGVELRAVKPEHLPRLIDTESVTIGDDGQVTGAGEAVKAFLEANPEYVGSERPKPGPVDQGARGGGAVDQLTREDMSRMSPEEIDKAYNEGRFDSLLNP